MRIAESSGQSGFARFVSSPAGRLVRLVVGIGLITWGSAQRGSSTGLVLMVAGARSLGGGRLRLVSDQRLAGRPDQWRTHPRTHP